VRERGGIPIEQRMALTVEEAAALLGLSRSKAYQLVRKGVIPSVDLDGMKRIPRRRLEELLESAS